MGARRDPASGRKLRAAPTSEALGVAGLTMFVQKINVALAKPVEFVLAIKGHSVNPIFSAALRGRGQAIVTHNDVCA